MPIYEYVCTKCRQPFEWLSRADEKPACPSCGATKLDKQLSRPFAHTASAGAPVCPAKEDGSCGVEHCCGRSCGMADYP